MCPCKAGGPPRAGDGEHAGSVEVLPRVHAASQCERMASPLGPPGGWAGARDGVSGPVERDSLRATGGLRCGGRGRVSRRRPEPADHPLAVRATGRPISTTWGPGRIPTRLDWRPAARRPTASLSTRRPSTGACCMASRPGSSRLSGACVTRSDPHARDRRSRFLDRRGGAAPPGFARCGAASPAVRSDLGCRPGAGGVLGLG